MPGPTVYVETTIPSYLAARPSRDLLIAAHQQLTWEWWDGERHKYALTVSPVVTGEVRRGNPDVAKRRVELLAEAQTLPKVPAVGDIASQLFATLRLPERALADAWHFAFAIHYEIDYLLTWNCAHLANGPNLKTLAAYTQEEALWLPIVCTPEALMPHRGGEIDVP